MSNFSWNQFSELTNAKELNAYMTREFTHSEYSHYTNLTALNGIVDKKCLWLCCAANVNDKKESDAFGEDKYSTYMTCFSTGVNENLSLWYMYSGIDGKGGRISFTKSSVRKILEQSEFYLSTKHSDLRIDLNENNSEISFKDVLYYSPKKDKKYVDLKYNTMTNHGSISSEEFEKYKKQNSGFCKTIIWYYEKETRIIASLKGELKQKVIKDTLPKDDNYVIKMDFSKIKNCNKLFKIVLAPEIVDIEEAVKNKSAIKKYILETSNIRLSDYNGQIEMNLFSNCCKDCDIAKEAIAANTNDNATNKKSV